MGNHSFYQNLLSSFFFLLSCFYLNAQDQFERDNAGNPIITDEFIQQVVLPMQFETIEKEKINVADFKGKLVIIDFWQTWCKPCLIGFKGLQKAKAEWPDKIEVLAASPDWSDDNRKIKKFSKDKGYDFQYILAGELEDELELKSIPYKIIIDPSGKLVYSKSAARSVDYEYRQIKKLLKEYDL